MGFDEMEMEHAKAFTFKQVQVTEEGGGEVV